MILYFSGTGNSRHAAEKLAELTRDEVRPLAEDYKAAKQRAVKAQNALVFVFPIQYGKLPGIVEDRIAKTPFTGNKDAFFIATFSGSAGNAEKQVLRLCGKKGLRFRGFLSLLMPENDIIDKSAFPKDKAADLIAQADKKLEAIAGQIHRNEMLRYEEPSGGGRSLFEKLFSPFRAGAKGFRAEKGCDGCGACVQACPMKNIRLENGKPVWGNACVRCTACINRCPHGAIEYGNKTQGKERYYFGK